MHIIKINLIDIDGSGLRGALYAQVFALKANRILRERIVAMN